MNWWYVTYIGNEVDHKCWFNDHKEAERFCARIGGTLSGPYFGIADVPLPTRASVCPHGEHFYYDGYGCEVCNP